MYCKYNIKNEINYQFTAAEKLLYKYIFIVYWCTQRGREEKEGGKTN